MSNDDPDREADPGVEGDSWADEPTDTFDEDDESPFEVIDEPETGDPFDRIDVEQRENDPFEQLSDRDASLEANAERDVEPEPFGASGSGTEPGAASNLGDEPGEAASPGTPTLADSEDDPFSGFGRDERAGDPFEELTGESVGSEDSARPDSDLWEELSRSEVEPETETHGQRRFAEVSKHTYCERCEHFSEPPEIACAHEGTDIIEFVDFETVRVADCPIVAEREQLADMDRER